MDGGGDAVALGVAEEEEDELEFPAVVLPAVGLPPLAAVLFPVVFCANVEVVPRFNAAIIATVITIAATIKPSN